MKIGILTFHDALNCGAVLQAFALQEYLKQFGHEIEFINYSCRPPFSIKRILGRNISNTIAKIKNFVNATRYGCDKSYNEILNVSSKRYTEKTLGNTNNEYDLFIVGSDQLWNFQHSLNCVYLLDFVHDKSKKIAYAVSMGQCEIPTVLHDELRNKLMSFKSISCREQNAVAFLNGLMGPIASISQCVDPTLLISANHYATICKAPSKINYSVSYILNSINTEQTEIIAKYYERHNLALVNIRNPDTCVRLPYTENIIVKPGEWLGYIQNSKSVICGSFHAVVFSLIFHKPFVVIESEKTYASGGNQRIRSLLRPLGLENRCIYINDLETIMSTPINWNDIDKKIELMRVHSQDFLKAAISL